MSARARPASTAERAIGSERKRSTTPVAMSSASPTAVPMIANANVWTMIPAIRYSWYEPPGTAIAPPNTNANSTTNISGCSVTSISFSGTCRTWLRLRLVSARQSPSAQRSRVAGEAVAGSARALMRRPPVRLCRSCGR